MPNATSPISTAAGSPCYERSPRRRCRLRRRLCGRRIWDNGRWLYRGIRWQDAAVGIASIRRNILSNSSRRLKCFTLGDDIATLLASECTSTSKTHALDRRGVACYHGQSGVFVPVTRLWALVMRATTQTTRSTVPKRRGRSESDQPVRQHPPRVWLQLNVRRAAVARAEKQNSLAVFQWAADVVQSSAFFGDDSTQITHGRSARAEEAIQRWATDPPGQLTPATGQRTSLPCPSA